nr:MULTISPECIES: glycosyltransferase family 2 protein [unclassified Novosphingobium]
MTYNEQSHIERAIRSVASFATEIFVIDSFSTDNTVDIARKNGAQVIQRAFVNYAEQFQWGLDNLPITSNWTMRLDADEIIDPPLAAEIVDRLPALTADMTVGGINLKRRHVFMGRWVRHGGRYPLILTRLWRTGSGCIEDRWMDEHIVVAEGRMVLLENYFSDVNLGDLTFFTAKHNGYATREAIDALNEKYSLFASAYVVSTRTASRQATFKRFVKERVYNRLPFWVGPLGYFLYRYIVQLGFLDGPTGLIYHFLQGFWYRFLVGAKRYEYDKALAPLPGATERLAMLEKLTGKQLGPIGTRAVPRLAAD